ncbi:MAG: MFS transporter [Halieaceae bacterium]|jgi:MFS family permease|nr:MFS transporter [Halieaceae bacterium]
MSDTSPAQRRAAFILFAVVLLDMIGFGIVIPILPFITPRLGGSDFDIALIIASYAVFAVLAGPLWGRASDHFGRKPVLMLCTVGAAVAYFLLAVADTLWMIYAARALAGSVAGNFPVASAMMADVTSQAERAKGMGLIGAAFGLGLVVGPLLGGVLAGPDGSFLLPCLLAAVMSLSAVAAAWLFLPESRSLDERRNARPSPGGLWEILRATQSRMLMLQYFLHTGSISAITYLFPLWVYALLDWQAREVGIVFGVVGAIMAMNQGLLMGRFVRLFGEINLLRVCTSLFLAGLSLALFARGEVAMVASLILALGGATLCMPVLNAMTSRRGAVDDRGRLLGAASAAAGIGRVAGPIVAGALLTWGGFRVAWLLPFAMVLFYCLWAFSAWARRDAPVQPA